MYFKPLISGLSEKFYDCAMIVLVTLMYIGLCAEADMFVPALPQMIEYFNVAENKIQLILSINFAGLCGAGLFVGPLSDSYGRRPILLVGLGMFFLSSIGCFYSHSFQIMLFWRLMQGISASVPMIIGSAAFMDKYSQEKAGQIIGVLNSVISASMAGAPILGAWISKVYDWRANFITISVLAFITFLGTWLFIKETLPQHKRKQLKIKILLNNYLKLLTNLEFIAYSTIFASVLTCVIVYVSNLSVIFINHLGMGLAEFSYWQATTRGTFIVFSLISMKLISLKGMDYSKNLGCSLSLLGAIGLLSIAIIDPGNVQVICLAMAFVSAGGALFCNVFGVRAMSIFPEINGTASSMMTAIKQLLTAGAFVISGKIFDGTIVPIAQIIFGVAVGCSILYFILIRKKGVK